MVEYVLKSGGRIGSRRKSFFQGTPIVFIFRALHYSRLINEQNVDLERATAGPFLLVLQMLV